MRAVVVTDVGTFSVQDVPDPVPEPGDVVVEVKASGLCGTDVHLIRGDMAPAAFPFIPGHEVAGRVVDRGTDPSAPENGSPITVHPFIECGTCRLCTSGRPNICLAPQMLGVGGRAGGCSDYVAVPARKVFNLADLPYAAGVLVEPLACVVHALTLVPEPSRSCLVIGGGVTGALFIDLLRVTGSRLVAVVDREPTKRDAATQRGATSVFASIADAVTAHGSEFDLVVDAVGGPDILEGAVDAVSVGGDILQFGIPGATATASFNPINLYRKEFRVVGSRGLGDDYPAAIEHLRHGVVDWRSLVEPPVGLEDFGRALEDVESGRSNRSILAP